jgi:hypothetical protein
METNDPKHDAIRAGDPGELRNLGRRAQPSEPRAAVSRYPVATSCPNCGCKEFKRVKVDRLVAFTDDRECTTCGARYTPPTPVWAAAVFILIGVLITAVGAAGVGVYGLGVAGIGIAKNDPVSLLHLGVAAVVTGIGFACTIFGIRSLRSREAPGKSNGRTG